MTFLEFMSGSPWLTVVLAVIAAITIESVVWITRLTKYQLTKRSNINECG